MKHIAKSIRPFIGSTDFEVSRSFYSDLGFTETILSPGFSLFRVTEEIGFYLQDANVKDWIDNSMLFLEVDDVDRYWAELQALALDKKYPGIRLIAPRSEAWGKECSLQDPSGILWHFGQFNS